MLKENIKDEKISKIIDLILDKDKPELWINEDIKSFYKFDNSKDCRDIKIKKYKHAGPIKMPIAK